MNSEQRKFLVPNLLINLPLLGFLVLSSRCLSVVDFAIFFTLVLFVYWLTVKIDTYDDYTRDKISKLEERIKRLENE